MSEYTIVHYTENGRDIFQEWLDELRDVNGRDAINRTLRKVERGNLGDHKPCRDGVWELRIHVGAGYRVYFFPYDSGYDGVKLNFSKGDCYCLTVLEAEGKGFRRGVSSQIKIPHMDSRDISTSYPEPQKSPKGRKAKDEATIRACSDLIERHKLDAEQGEKIRRIANVGEIG